MNNAAEPESFCHSPFPRELSDVHPICNNMFLSPVLWVARARLPAPRMNTVFDVLEYPNPSAS